MVLGRGNWRTIYWKISHWFQPWICLNISNSKVCQLLLLKLVQSFFMMSFCKLQKLLVHNIGTSKIFEFELSKYFALLLIKKNTKFCKQQKIGGFKYFGDSDVMNKLIDSNVFQGAFFSQLQTFVCYCFTTVA